MIFALVDFDVQVIGLRVAMKKHLGKQVFPDPQADNAYLSSRGRQAVCSEHAALPVDTLLPGKLWVKHSKRRRMQVFEEGFSLGHVQRPELRERTGWTVRPQGRVSVQTSGSSSGRMVTAPANYGLVCWKHQRRGVSHKTA